MSRSIPLVSTFLVSLAVAGCAAKSPAPGLPAGGNGDPSATQPAAGAPSSGSAAEACTQLGATRACCGAGTQTCQAQGEFPTWGPCLDAAGATVTCNGSGCPGEFQSCDGGTPSPPDMGTTPPQSCVCKPDSVRYCDENVPGIEWSKQQCTAQSTWGPCVSTPPPAGCAGPDGYNPVCCAGLGLCCQDGVNGPFIGNCTATKC